MAETILSVVTKEMLKKVISLATEQLSLVWGFKEELIRLRASVEMIQALLVDVKRRQVTEAFVRLWLQRLKDVAFDADDVLDEFAYEILRRKVEVQNQMKRKVCFFFSLSNPIDGQQAQDYWQFAKRINDEANQFGLIRLPLVNASPETIPN